MILTLIFLTAGAVAAQKTFYNKEFKFGFTYAAGLKLSTNPDDLQDAPPLKGLAQLSITNPGRGLFDATANIAAGPMTLAECRALSTAEDKPRKKTFGTVTFDKTEEIEGGMETVHPQEFYRTFHNGVCYEARLGVGMEKNPKRAVNDAAAFERLYGILRTFYFK